MTAKTVFMTSFSALLSIIAVPVFADSLPSEISVASYNGLPGGASGLPGTMSALPENSVTSATLPFGLSMLDRTDAYLTSKFNGQALGSPWGTTYSPFARGTGPIYFYHTFDAIYHFDRLNSVGMELSATQDLVHGAHDSLGSTVEPAFTGYDPQLWYRRNSLVNNDWVFMDGQISVFPGVTDYSRNTQTMIFSTAFDTTWNLKFKDRRWTAYFTTRARPTVYNELHSQWWGEQREWLFLSTGHFASYHLSSSWEIATSSLFDCDFYADNVGSLRHGDANDDRAALQLNYYSPHGFARVGAYFQSVITNPTVASSVVGMDLTINFLTAKSM